VPHPAQVPLAFFTDRRNEADGRFGIDVPGLKRPRKRNKTHNAAGVIADAWRVEPRAFAAYPHICAFRKNGIEVR
jgi:hypothetical protein